MIRVNADDWGRSRADTDAAIECLRAGRVTSVSAMVFMDDSERAAALAAERGADVGLHFNFSETITVAGPDRVLADAHAKVVRFLNRSKYALLSYQPFLRGAFQRVCQAQVDEFTRLYGKPPARFDGHQHMHLCTNVLLGRLIPAGAAVRRSFTFRHGEKGAVNRLYRAAVDRWLAGRYRISDSFFSLSDAVRAGRLEDVFRLARTADVELMTHPARKAEREVLMSTAFQQLLTGLKTAGDSTRTQGAEGGGAG